ncbi:ricin B-like lectin R40G3 [Cornus florida]|uniref:ricin B-like lectin R40G3 n=1 Tax=Cornus florida TaxID=4283 RepID=UPI0028989C50|nr:ricin B-like lectin R40G3 [Cornus florida]
MADDFAFSVIRDKPSHRVYCQAGSGFSLAVRDDEVILASNDAYDPYQQWVKDETYSMTVMDEKGNPSFALINKATGQALQHAFGDSHPVRVKPWNPDEMDYSILWTQSEDMGGNFRTIRMVNDITLNIDALHGNVEDPQGICDGTTIVLWQWNHGGNQLWRIDRTGGGY